MNPSVFAPLVILALLNAGCMKSTVPVSALWQAQDLTTGEARIVSRELPQAFGLLLSCDYLQTRHPATYQSVTALADTLILVGHTQKEGICAEAYPARKLINLNFREINSPGSNCWFTKSLAHELLHLAGLKHDTYAEEKTFYATLEACLFS